MPDESGALRPVAGRGRSFLGVRRMLPGGPLARKQYGNLRIYAGETHPHEAQSPTKLDVASFNTKNVRAK